MEQEIARLVLDFFGFRVDPPSDHEELVAAMAETIRKRFGNPIYPKAGESLAVSVMTPKTSALAFDRVHRNPALIDPIPEEVGFYCATPPEVILCAAGIFLKTVEELGWRNDLTDKYSRTDRSLENKAASEKNTLRLMCSDFQRQLGVVPTIFYHARNELQREFPVGARPILRAAISNVALVDEGSLTWDQVIEFRKDAEVRKKYRRFVRWVDDELKARSPQEAEDLIARRLDDYEWALKKHGVKASLGAISCLLDPKFLGAASAAVAATAVAGDGFWAAVTAASLTVGRAAINFGTAMIDGVDERRRENYEVAYLYEVQKRFG